MKQSTDVFAREVRVRLPINENPNKNQPLSENICDLIAGLAAAHEPDQDDNGRLIKLEQFDDLACMQAEHSVEFC